MDKIFSTPQERNEAISDLESGVGTPFWRTFCKILDANIAYAKRQLEEGTGVEEETKESIQRVRDRLKIYRDIRHTPETMVQRLKQPDIEEESLDPYDQLPDPDLTTETK